MKASDIFEATTGDVVEEFVNTDLMNKVGDVLNQGHSVGTVHFTLAYMIAVDIGEGDDLDPSKIAVGILTIQQFIYSTAMAAYQHKRKAGAH